ncbi:hypothetical protein HNO91_17320 [Pseudomonas corrugata]|uniref:CdiI immunity protein domain-containing protein n=1 Tax=Pseudomonas corrugata TaxID=47879 RepID=A0A7Y6DII3_9PSED|nr:hypothetical protein [Pseudomonas corrugata]NUT88199.1 hypothetical protein [Pseudomonas corrugata]
MGKVYDLHDIWGLLFVFSIENTRSEAREKIIASKDVNDNEELAQLFDMLVRPEFFLYAPQERNLLIDTLSHFLAIGDSFDYVFRNMDTYFDSDVKDRRQFMQVLLDSLNKYQAERQ